MSNELLKALNGAQGELDAWLEDHNESEVREAILSLIGNGDERRRIAAMAMQGMCACINSFFGPSQMAEQAVACADALLAELSKGEPK